MTEFESTQFPILKARLEEAAGFGVPLEVRWDTLAVANESHLYADSWPLVYFEPLIGAFQKGCVFGDCWATLDGGVLTLDHESITNINDKDARQKGLVAVLENSL